MELTIIPQSCKLDVREKKQSSKIAYVILENGVSGCFADIAVGNQKLL